MNSEQPLAERLTTARSPEQAFETVLKTSDRVLARITDGIYRQPGSALRELLANAYDADATDVTISTDRPRFQRIRIEDNGNGMSPAIIQYVLENIGGSSKRVNVGGTLGVTSSDDFGMSPSGRRLIGRIGIGLFSVSQLARSFHIVTKQVGDEYFSIIRFMLKQYADDVDPDDTGEHEAGIAQLWQEKAENPESHGTTVVLYPLRVEAINRLRSLDEWELHDAADDGNRREAPTFHIGRLRNDSEEHLREFGQVSYDNEQISYDDLPWQPQDTPPDAFAKFIAAVQSTAAESQNNTKLEGICDRYLRMVWDLSLSLPLPYVEQHPLFDTLAPSIVTYVRDSRKVQQVNIGEAAQRSMSSLLDIDDASTEERPFRVILDDLELARPLTFSDFPVTQRARQEPILLAQHVEESFDGIAPQLSGGALEFYAYLLWAPKLVPRDRAGALVRIHGASGTGFDDGFLRYQTRERIRLGQTSCEIFVVQGLEGALNIDRESFNYAHPHVIYLSNWLHNALTSLFTEEKRLSSNVREAARESRQVARTGTLHRVAEQTWQQESGKDEEVPIIEVREPGYQESSLSVEPSRPSDRYRIERPVLSGSLGVQAGPVASTAELEAIFQILASFDLLRELDAESLQRLAVALAEVLEVTRNG